MIRAVLFTLLSIGLIAVDANACQRCGILGRGCRYQTYSYQVPVQHVAAVVQQPDVFVVQNNYPQPIAAQGQTLYGYQAAAQVYAVNPAEVLRQAAELSKAATATAQLGLTGFNQTAQTQLQLQAAITEPLVRGQAAAQVLTAAGLSGPSALQQPQSYALKITHEAGGLKVEQLDAGQITAKIETSIGGSQPSSPTTATPDRRNSLVAQKCAKCHGLDKAQPKGEVFVDAGYQLECDTFADAILRITSKDEDRMPPDETLTDEEIAKLKSELKSLRKPKSG